MTGDVDRRIDWAGLELAPFPMSQQEGQLDLTMMIIDGGDRLGGYLSYNADLFDAATVEQMPPSTVNETPFT